MFHVNYEVDSNGQLISRPKVGCNICRCEEGDHIRCFHHPVAMFAVQTYLYFENVWEVQIRKLTPNQ